MDAVDQVILDLLTDAGVAILDGYVPTDNTGKTVIYPVPYAVYYSSLGDDSTKRLSGRNTRRSVFWSITYVGGDRRQAKWAGQKVRDALEGKRPDIAGATGIGLIEVLESQRVRRDDDAIHADGSPLFYGVDNYALPVNINR